MGEKKEASLNVTLIIKRDDYNLENANEMMWKGRKNPWRETICTYDYKYVESPEHTDQVC